MKLKSRPISEDIIHLVQESVDIVHLIAGYVNLKKAGQNFVGLCPFHSEKTPSFTVSISKQIFHCFGCHAGGNAFKFLMMKEGIPFPEAVRELGKMAGISIPVEEEGKNEPEQDLFSVNEAAKEYFHQLLLNDPEAGRAREYLRKREISDESIREFSIGFALADWHHCSKFLETKGFTLAQMEKAGLIVRRSSGEGYHDRFRERLMFPVSNLQGHCVGFGGRVLDDSLPKYLNSPETPVYHKGKTLYAQNKIRNEKTHIDSLIIVEGYFDAIRAYQSGIRNVVATCGTSLTHSHLQLIRRVVRKIYLIFDPDVAGQKAALRTIDLFFGSGIKVYVVLLSEGLDPDLFIKKYGREPFDRHLEQAIPLFDFVLKASIHKNSTSDIEGKIDVLREIFPLVNKLSNSVERSYYINKLSNELSISEVDMWKEFKKLNHSSVFEQKTITPPKDIQTFPLEEEYVLRFLLAEKIPPGKVFKYVSPEDFSDLRVKKILKVLFEKYCSEEKLNFHQFLEIFSEDPSLYEMLTLLSVKEPDYDFPLQALEESLDRLIYKRMRRHHLELEKEIRIAEKEKSHEKIAEISKLLLKLRIGLKERVKL